MGYRGMMSFIGRKKSYGTTFAFGNPKLGGGLKPPKLSMKDLVFQDKNQHHIRAIQKFKESHFD